MTLVSTKTTHMARVDQGDGEFFRVGLCEEQHEFMSRVGGDISVAVAQVMLRAYDAKILTQKQCVELLTGITRMDEVVEKAIGVQYDAHHDKNDNEYECFSLATITVWFKDHGLKVYTLYLGQM